MARRDSILQRSDNTRFAFRSVGDRCRARERANRLSSAYQRSTTQWLNESLTRKIRLLEEKRQTQ